MRTLTPTEIQELLEEFNGQRCFVFDVNDKFLSEGTIALSPTFQAFLKEVKRVDTAEDKNKIKVSVKNMNKQLNRGAFVVKSIIFIERLNKYVKLHIPEQVYELFGTAMTHKIEIESIIIEDSNESEYEIFRKKVYVYEWENIIIPQDCSGKDSYDAFEDLCLKLIESWGGKSIIKTGKGPDSGRDGQFLVEMDSWIPIITGYSTRWILQCKYSKEAKNLQKEEIYRDMVKALEFQPDYFLLMTNRNFTNQFETWFNSDLMKEPNYYIPFKKIIIQRELLESELSQPQHESLRKKYFD